MLREAVDSRRRRVPQSTPCHTKLKLAAIFVPPPQWVPARWESRQMTSTACRGATADERPADSDEGSIVSNSPSTGMWPVGGPLAARICAVLGALDNVKRQYRAGISHHDFN